VPHRGAPYRIFDNNGNPVTAEQARQIIAEKLDRPRGRPQTTAQPRAGGEVPSGGRNPAAQARRPSPTPILTTPEKGRQPIT
jgi:hypothetical protein